MSLAYRSPGCAAVLSFFVIGLGQIYNGDVGLGILIFFCEGLLGLLSLTISLGFSILVVALWIWNIVNAYRRASFCNEEACGYDRELSRTGSPPSSLDEHGRPPSAEDIPTIRQK
jgi:TM2 domain-containing membrane protein YozV